MGVVKVGGGGHWAVPELLKVTGAENLEGVLIGMANWPGKRQAELEKRFMAKTGEPWFGHDSIFAYAHVMILKEAIERDRRTTCTIRSVEPFWIVGKKTKSLCYITTATCRAQGLPDDCAELTTLRL